MKPINTAADVREFQGKVVAFQADTTYYNKMRGETGVLRFGVVSKEVFTWHDVGQRDLHHIPGYKGELPSGPRIERFLRPSESNGECAIYEAMLAGANMKMREATREEMAALAEKVTSGKEIREYHSHDMRETLRLLGVK
ncbi:MAG: hypothetical protein MRY21_03015 [Simkaniaceae bacterium]|nr:hypothetical protein [Simkaniaceae bacterium]